MLINKAYASTPDIPGTVSETHAPPVLQDVPGPGNLIMQNIGMVVVLVALFYVLLILPQQRRFKEHSQMLSAMKKGDRVITGGGLVGVIDKIDAGDEVIVDLGNGMKVTALRAALTSKDPALKKKNAANDAKNKKD